MKATFKVRNPPANVLVWVPSFAGRTTTPLLITDGWVTPELPSLSGELWFNGYEIYPAVGVKATFSLGSCPSYLEDIPGACVLPIYLTVKDGGVYAYDFQTKTIVVEYEPPTTYAVGMGIYSSPGYDLLAGTLILDGVQHSVNAGKYLLLEGIPGGLHTFDLVVPAGYKFLRWEVWDWLANTLMMTQTYGPYSITLDRSVYLFAFVEAALVAEPEFQGFGIAEYAKA